MVAILLGLFFEDLYERIHVKSRVLLLQQLSLVLGIALLIQGIIGYMSDGFRLPVRGERRFAGALTIVALFAWRIVYSAVGAARAVGPQRILFVGMSPLLEEMAGHIAAHPELGLETIGYIDNGVAPAAPVAPPASQSRSKILGPLSALREIAAAVKPDRIVVGFADNAASRCPLPAFCNCAIAARSSRRLPSLMSSCAGALSSCALRKLFSPAHSGRVPSASSTRPGQLAPGASFGYPFRATAAARRNSPDLSSGGPLLDRKECAGLGARPFTLYRLRLPVGEGAGMNRAQKFVRRWRLDALPHLWNILRGEMCFVGPRAERPEFVNALSDAIPFYRQRYRVKPGLTGWAQINMPPDQPEDTLRRLEYDFYYLKNFSRGLDTYIVVDTFKELLISRTAA